ncbi:MAG: ComEC/Rec2 family competence protein [Bacteroidota bacterium]
MSQVRELPFVRLLIPFLVGIGIAWSHPFSFPALDVLLWLSLSLAIYARWKPVPFGMRWWPGLLYSLFFGVLGHQMCLKNNELAHSDHFHHHMTKDNGWIGAVSQLPEEGKRIRLTMEVDQLLDGGKKSIISCRGQLLVHLPVDSSSRRLQLGDRLLVRGKAQAIAAVNNPNAFDYRKYLALRNVHHQLFVDSSAWQLLGGGKEWSVFGMALQFRQELLDILQKHLTTPNEYAVGAALLLGYKQALGADIRQAYSGTGAMHVLAVSGLHVGLIYLLLHFVLQRWHVHKKRWILIKVLLLLAGVWGFALLTGASASVMRAATMISFVIVGKQFWRHTNIYNTLATSAFCLLYVNPYLLLDVGFQLSYLAVIGIVYFQGRIHRLWSIENRWGDAIWKLLSVSLAAQLTTFPISLYYFHQFPLFFWLSGLVVVPAAVGILAVGIALFLCSQLVPILAVAIGKLLYGMIWLTNACIFLIQQIPGGRISDLWIDGLPLVLCYVVIILFAIGMERRNSRWHLASLATLLVISACQFSKRMGQHQQNGVLVYAVGKNGLVDFYDGRTVYTWQSAGLSERQQEFAAANHRMARGLTRRSSISLGGTTNWAQLAVHQNAIHFGGTNWLILEQPLRCPQNRFPPLKALYLRNKARMNLAELSDCLTFDYLIVDSSVGFRQRKKWKEYCFQNGIQFKDVSQSGALYIPLNN